MLFPRKKAFSTQAIYRQALPPELTVCTLRSYIHNGFGMPKVVKCEICGGLYNQSHLSSHKRLSHGKCKTVPASPKSEQETLGAILSMFERLSDDGKREILSRLSAPLQTKP